MENILKILKDMGPLKLTSIVSGFLIMIFIGIIIFMKTSTDNFVPLYGNLDLKDSSKIITELESRSIPYQLRAEGTEILVPESQVLKLRMNMAQAGIPSKGALVGYEIFDNSDSLGTSNFVQNVNLLRALEGELARTISSFTNIESARVHLVTPKKELFSREKQNPSASIIISMRGSAKLSKEEINAISHLVATAVPSLELSKITIVDTSGRSLKLGAKDENDPGISASNTEEYKINYENRMNQVIEDLLEQSLGAGHVKAQVSAEFNFDRVVTNYESYDPSSQVARSIQEVSDKGSSAEGSSNDSVGVAGNLPTGAGGADGGTKNSNNNERSETTTNYEISKTVKNSISETGVVKRLSIAVLIEWIYKTNKDTGDVTYSPRTKEELDKYESLVKTAVGYDESRKDKVEIINMQFTNDLSTLAQESNVVWLKRELPNMVQTIVVGLVVVMILILVVRPVALRAFESARDELDDINEISTIEDIVLADSSTDLKDQLGMQEPMIDISKIDARLKSNNTYKAVNDIITKYPQETVGAFRKWLNKD